MQNLAKKKTIACEQALAWVLCARCETQVAKPREAGSRLGFMREMRVAKPRERGAQWAGLGEERGCSYYCKFFISALPERSLIPLAEK